MVSGGRFGANLNLVLAVNQCLTDEDLYFG